MNGNATQILKAASPYLPGSSRRFIGIYIQIRELQSLLAPEEKDGLSICSGSEEKHSLDDMLSAIREYCDSKQQETIDMLLHITQAFSLFEQYKDIMPDMASAAFSNMEPMDMQEVFETLVQS